MNTRKFYLILTSMLTSFLFISGVYLLYQIGTTSVVKSEDNKKPEGFINQIIQPFVVDKSPVNILLLGGDKVAGNTDTMMIVNFNPETAKISLLSVPRDTRVKIKGLGYTKINAAYPRGGADLAVDTVTNFLGTCIQYYVYVDTAAFRNIVDILDGVDYYVPIDLKYNDPIQKFSINLKKGQQHLDGKKAEQFMRFRQPGNGHYSKEMLKYYDGSDIKRIEAQQGFIKELIRQKTSLKYMTRINDIISEAFDRVETNITLSDALKLSTNINKINVGQVEMFKVPCSSEPKINGIWYYLPDRAKTKDLVDQYFKSDLGTAPSDYNNSADDDVELKKKPAKSYTKNNPSNKEAAIKGSSTPKP